MKNRQTDTVLPISPLTPPSLSQPTLDPNTAHRELYLSAGNRKVTRSAVWQPYSDHQERFDHWDQILCREALSGPCCYWEAEWSGEWVDVAVAYRGISRKGEDDSLFGRNDKSWSLECPIRKNNTESNELTVWHNNKSTRLATCLLSTVGVYLDCGTLSFFSVPDIMTLLLRVKASFTETLYAGFRVDNSVTLCQLE
ncbi:tripartite motif-containing protein 16-like [Amia ocellicauda]|uniref:tripartite motif-containing protein 16-like n=1 Tax=Amia ocellicauda TaxID=2972642 RepID=UPI00346396FB